MLCRRPNGLDAQRSAPSGLVNSFLGSLGNTPILSGTEEQRLAQIIARGEGVKAAAARLAKERRQRPPLADVAAAAGLPTARAAARAVLLADVARSLMVDFNLRMVFSIAKRYTGKGLELADLIPEGVIGLRRAIERFDPGKGFKFSTYAHWWIRQSVTRAISDQGRDIRLPVHVVEFLSKMKKAQEQLKAQPGRTAPPSHAEIAAAMGVSLERLSAVLHASKTLRSPEDIMSGPSTGGNVKDIGKEADDALEVFQDMDDPLPDGLVEAEREEYLREALTLLLSTIDVRQRNILRLRYGISPLAPGSSEASAENILQNLPNFDEAEDPTTAEMSLKDVGEIMQLSRERIRQVENAGVLALKSSWRMKLMKAIKGGDIMSPDMANRLLNSKCKAEADALRQLTTQGPEAQFTGRAPGKINPGGPVVGATHQKES